MYATNYFETMVLNTLRGQNATAPGTLYVGLYLSNPGEEGAGTEVSYPNYARQPITFTPPAAQNGGLGMRNTADIVFPESTVATQAVTHIGVLDSPSGGNMLLYGEFTDPAATAANSAPNIVAGEAQWWQVGHMTNAFRTRVMNLLRGQSIAGFMPYLGLYNGNPDSGGAELSGGGYERVAIALTAPAEQVSGQTQVRNSEELSTKRALSAWGTWAYTVICDAATSGTPIYAVERNALSIRLGQVVKIRPGELNITMN